MFFDDDDEDMKDADARKTFRWRDNDKKDKVMYRIPRNIKWNDNVIVREDEAAVFYRDGKAMHVFDRPGRYAMSTENVPVLSKLVSGATGIKQLGEIFYIQRRVLRGKFGTSEPLTFRDQNFGLVRIKCFGRFAYKVEDPSLFINEFVGTKGLSSSEEVEDWCRSQLVMCLNDALGELKKEQNMAVADMPAYLQEIEQLVLSKINPELQNYGLKITKIIGINLNLPDKVEEAIDKQGAMRTVGADYTEYQTGQAVENIGEGAAKGEGGGASNMSGMGAGMGAGMGLAKEMSEGMSKESKDNSVNCPNCNHPNSKDANFCQNCGTKLGDETKHCSNCGVEVDSEAKFCSECGTNLQE